MGIFSAEGLATYEVYHHDHDVQILGLLSWHTFGICTVILLLEVSSSTGGIKCAGYLSIIPWYMNLTDINLVFLDWP